MTKPKAKVVAWNGQPMLVATPHTDLGSVKAWPWQLVGEDIDLRGMCFFVLCYVPGSREWGAGIHPRLMGCLHRWLSAFGSAFAVVGFPHLRWPIPVPLEPWGPIGALECEYWYPECSQAYASPRVGLRIPDLTMPLALGTISTEDIENFCHAWLKRKEQKPATRYSPARADIVLVPPERLAGRLLLGAYRGDVLEWAALAAALREACNTSGITYVEEGLNQPVILQPALCDQKGATVTDRYIAPRVVVRNIDTPPARRRPKGDVSSPGNRNGNLLRLLARLANAPIGSGSTVVKTLVSTVPWLLMAGLGYVVASFLRPLAWPFLATKFWRARICPSRLINRLQNRFAFPRDAMSSQQIVCRCVLFSLVPEAGHDPSPCISYRLTLPEGLVLASALLKLGEFVCPVSPQVADLFVRLSGRSSLEVVRRPGNTRAEGAEGRSWIMKSADLRWLGAVLPTLELYDTVAYVAGASEWRTPFLRDVVVVADGRRARGFLSGDHLTRLLYALRDWTAYCRVFARSIRAIAFRGSDTHYCVAVAKCYRDLFLKTLRSAAHVLGMDFEIESDDRFE